jgi:F0F1-type ATP synthase delta subunit
MKTSRTRIAKTIADRTLAGDTPKDYARELAAYLLAEDRVDELDSLMRDVQADWATQGYIEVIARSAHPLSGETKADITKRVQEIYPTAHKIIVTEAIDPEVVGGVRLSLPGQQLDLSVEAKLNKFKQLTGAGKE